MNYRLHPLWWPLLFLLSPILILYLLIKKRSFQRNEAKTVRANRERIEAAKTLDIEPREKLKISIVLEGKSRPEYASEAGISYYLETEKEKILYDIGFGEEGKAFVNNYKKLDLNYPEIDGLIISHLHPDHMGGISAARSGIVKLPEIFDSSMRNSTLPIFLPENGEVNRGKSIIINSPRLIANGAASSGPLKGNLFFSGPTKEQALIFKLKDKGKVIITGCGHPDLNSLKQISERIVPGDVYALVGGLHLPIGQGRMKKAGIDLQRIIGTGMPPWHKPGKRDLDRTISLINDISPQRVLLSPHDTSDYALDTLQENLKAKTDILQSGSTFSL